MSGKGKKKSKANKNSKTVTLSSFLADDQDVPAGYTVVKPSSTNWADVMEEEALDDRFTLISNVVLPTAPKASRGPDIDLSRVPSHPPFTAYIGNLAYDISEDDIRRFFRNMKVVSVRLPREQGEKSRFRGFGYVEFENRESLIDALSLNNEKLRNRIVKINLAEDKDHNGDRRGGGEDHTSSDWRAKENEPWRHDSRDRNDSRYYRGRGSYDSRDGGGRRYDDDRYGDRSRDRGRRVGDADSSWRRGGPPEPREPERPKERPKLVLQPRSIPKEASDSDNPPVQSSIFGGAKPVDTYSREKEIEKKLESLEIAKPAPPASVPSSSIFGGAKPVNTAAREMEIERKLLEQQREEEAKSRSGPPKPFSRARQSPSRRGGRGGFDREFSDRGRSGRFEDSRRHDSDYRREGSFDRRDSSRSIDTYDAPSRVGDADHHFDDDHPPRPDLDRRKPASRENDRRGSADSGKKSYFKNFNEDRQSLPPSKSFPSDRKETPNNVSSLQHPPTSQQKKKVPSSDNPNSNKSQKNRIPSDKPPNYISSNKFSNLLDEDSGEEHNDSA